MTVKEEYDAWDHIAHLLHAARSAGWNEKVQDDAERLVYDKKKDLEDFMAEARRRQEA